ncbi:MAG TPA: hypothetical protein VMZ69_02645, partial [Saprospiraceae bacterium]|nr:hypothetical protein [Saprospiraceae bacterium]
GENIIISHRLLKNSIPSKEYILITENFRDRCDSLDDDQLSHYEEYYEDIGQVNVFVKTFDQLQVIRSPLTIYQKIKGTVMLDKYMLGRLFKKNPLEYKNLPTR